MKTKKTSLLIVLFIIFLNTNYAYSQTYKFSEENLKQEIALDTAKYKKSIDLLVDLTKNTNLFNQKFINKHWKNAKITFFNETNGEISIQHNANNKKIELDQYFDLNSLEINSSSHLSIMIGSNEALIILMNPKEYEIYATDFHEKYGKTKERFLKDLEETILTEFNIKKY